MGSHIFARHQFAEPTALRRTKCTSRACGVNASLWVRPSTRPNEVVARAACKSCSLPLLHIIARPGRAERSSLRKAFTLKAFSGTRGWKPMQILPSYQLFRGLTRILLFAVVLTNFNLLAQENQPTDGGALWRSAVAPGWGQFYKGRTGWGYFYSIGFGISAISTIGSLVMWGQTKSDYINYQPAIPTIYPTPVSSSAENAELDRLYNRSKTWEQITAVSAIVTVSIYAFNVLDAYFGKIYKSKDIGKNQSAAPRLPVDISIQNGSGVSLAYKHAF